MKSLIILVILSILGGSVLAQIGAPCHNDIFTFTPRHSVNITTFLGTWYKHEYALSDIGNTPVPDYKCSRVNFNRPNQSEELELRAEESYIDIETDVVHTGVSNIQVTASRSPLSSLWTVTDPETGIEASVVILAADLELSKWSVIYSCEHRGPQNYRWESVTAYSRSRELDQETRDVMKALMVGIGMRIGDHQVVRQDGC